MRFSERHGYKPKAVELKESAMPRSLRAGLWDALNISYCKKLFSTNHRSETSYHPVFDHLTAQIWFNFFREEIEARTLNPSNCKGILRDRFMSFKFYEVYDFIEFVANVDFSAWSSLDSHNDFPKFCNSVLQRELAAFRFADRVLVKISSKEELEEIDVAMSDRSTLGVREHISSSARAFTRRPPDYRNCVKEAISAVESAVFTLTGTKHNGLSKPLADIQQKYGLHPALSKGFEKLYGYSSDKDGIRHAILDLDSISEQEARYMLVSCAAFSNYLLALRED